MVGVIVVLTGMPGAGKSTVGRLLAARLGAAFHDLDARLAAADPASRPAARILAEDGEPAFRAAEADAVRALAGELGDAGRGAAGRVSVVVATGGWTMGDPASRRAIEALGPVVCLTAAPATLAARLRPTAGDRPLLPRPDEGSLAALLAARRATYDAVPWQVATDGRRPDDVAGQVARLIETVATHGPTSIAAVPVATSEGPVGGLAGGYAVLVGDGPLDALGALLVARGIGGRAVVVSDANVGPLYGARVVASLERAGIAAGQVAIPPGEAAKSPAQLERLWAAFAAAGLERGDTVVALGGGVVTDLAGFAAATWLRGVRLVNAPTSLLGMVDAAVGGKTGIDLAAGKNLAGAFHAPALVACDVAALVTLPPAERRHGLAELVKAAVIDGESMLADLEIAAGGWLGAWAAGGVASRSGEPREAEALGAWIARALAVKARAVGGDLREARGGPREALNLGHTFAHGLEEASGYALPHGRAVAIGLVAAARLAADIGEARDAPDASRGGLAGRLEALLGRLGLPTRWDGVDVEAVLSAMANDKKRAGGALRFVLPRAPGDVVVRGGVHQATVRGVLAALRAG